MTQVTRDFADAEHGEVSLRYAIFTMLDVEVIVASNRGPVSFALDTKNNPVVASSGGGLAGTLRRLLIGKGATWVACSMGEADTKAASSGLAGAGAGEGINLVMVNLDPGIYHMAYDTVANSTLWFLHHHMMDLSRAPRFGKRWMEAWKGYRDYNQAFAGEIAQVADNDACVLVQDYHLALLPGILAGIRPDLRCIHFSHTPFAAPDFFGVLPTAVGRELITAMSTAKNCGFHTEKWADSYRRSCISTGIDSPTTFVSSLGVDAGLLREEARSAKCSEAKSWVENVADGRRLIVRTDRMEPSKNVLRGLWAFDELLAEHPQWIEQVVFLVLTYPSRQNLPEYLAYASEVETTVDYLNDKWSTKSWTPVVLDLSDDYYKSLAALSLYDLLMVNPVRDGLNLVAKEGPLVNERNGSLLLSREAGTFGELSQAAIAVNPYDVGETATAVHKALLLDDSERASRSTKLEELASTRTPEDWLDDQLSQALA
ncbi:MAG: trehalose-6-phosphate synthase [Actinobacteria bacterium]|nr:trehalose-6-phosphate synthase [Actinomycetota bacterium]